MGDRVVELEFDIGDADFLLVRASREASCNVRLEEVRQRSDGSVLEFISVEGAEPNRLQEVLSEAASIRSVRVLEEADGVVLLELVSKTPIATALADNGTTFTDIDARAGDGRLVAEVPPHIDTSAVIDAFLRQYPEAQLLARRETDRAAPTFTEGQFRSRALSELTDKQLQALRTAFSRGYYDWPRECTTADIAADLDIASSTLSQHLRVAEKKVMTSLLRDGRR